MLRHTHFGGWMYTYSFRGVRRGGGGGGGAGFEGVRTNPPFGSEPFFLMCAQGKYVISSEG